MPSSSVSSNCSRYYEGVWTDGTWVFSTGLDQRVRCWISKEQGTLREFAHFIISVPEPEALDARSFGWLVMHIPPINLSSTKLSSGSF